jgi:threonine dehydratase
MYIRAHLQLFFKCENFQRMGAFKFRGAHNALARYPNPFLRLGARVVDYCDAQHATSCRRRYEHQALHQLTL